MYSDDSHVKISGREMVMDCEGGERHRLASCEPNYLSLLFTQWMFVGATEGRQGSVCVWSGGGVCVSAHAGTHTWVVVSLKPHIL